MHSATDKKLDCVVRVITPENSEFEYLLAGPFQRLPAFILDIIFRWAILVAIVIACQFSGFFIGLPGTQWLLTAGIILLYFVISWFYGIALETLFNGRTVGKMIFRLRVISVDGRPIGAGQAAIRNLLRSADLAPLLSLQVFSPEAPPAYVIPTLFVGLISMILTSRMQRVGDLAAGTMVIVDRQNTLPTVSQPDDGRALALAEILPPTFQVSRSLSKSIGMYMETRKRFLPARRSEVAIHLARPLINHLGLMPDTSPDLLLCAIYARIFMSEDHRANSLAANRLAKSRAVAATPPVVAPGLVMAAGTLNPAAQKPESVLEEK